VSFDEAFNKVLGIEGGFVNDARDSGGATRYGITERVARAYGYSGSMDMMPLTIAKSIYREAYWDRLRLDQVASIVGARVAEEMFDTGVNQGVSAAGTYLQRALNALNQQSTLYADIPVDGDVGKLTLEALRSFWRRRGNDGSTVLLRALNALQGSFYIALAERRAKDEAFVFGWLLNRVQFA
jgi:lysozyme family protein